MTGDTTTTRGGQRRKGPAPRTRTRNRSKAIGTAAETAVVRYLRANGWPAAERRALKGVLDEGDITGTPGICWEVKARSRPVSDEQITAWLVETEIERANAGAEIGILVIRRPGFGTANVGRWWAVLRLGALLTDDEHAWALMGPDVGDAPVHMHLSTAVAYLRAAGYGTSDGGVS